MTAPSLAEPRAAVEQALRQQIAALRDLIINDIIFLDTVTLLTRSPVSPWVRQRLQRSANGEVKVEDTQAIGWSAAVRVQQPTPETIARITRYFPRHVICRCDLGIDALTRSRDDADTVNSALDHHMTQGWRGKRRRGTYEETIYWSFDQTQTTRNIAAYGDRCSKITGQPAAHFDLRMETTSFCRQRGINKAADLLTFRTS
jgi:hypothetical protein